MFKFTQLQAHWASKIKHNVTQNNYSGYKDIYNALWDNVTDFSKMSMVERLVNSSQVAVFIDCRTQGLTFCVRDQISNKNKKPSQAFLARLYQSTNKLTVLDEFGSIIEILDFPNINKQGELRLIDSVKNLLVAEHIIAKHDNLTLSLKK